jgi:DNA-binding NarL/FixJ family response regulator
LINMTKIGVVIADDHAIIRDGLRLMLSLDARFTVMADAIDGDEALQRVNNLRPDVLLLDMNLPGRSGLNVLETLRVQTTSTKILMVTGAPDPHLMRRAMDAGAAGFFAKNGSGQELVFAILEVMHGHVYVSPEILRLEQLDPVLKLTPREHEVFRAIGAGSSSKQIADQLELSLGTVNKHRENLITKLGVRGAAELVALAARRNLH